MRGDFLFYSTQPQIAHVICQKYYGEKFYVYCTKDFDTNPSSANPKHIYADLRDIAKSGDQGHPKYKLSKSKLKAIARKKREAGEITPNAYNEIVTMLNIAGPGHFEPVLYLINAQVINSNRVIDVNPKDRASLLSNEFIISDLMPDEFEVIECP